jgi:CHAT domain-containing protein
MLAPPSPQAQWERIEALIKMTDVEGVAADTSAALQNADAAAKALAELGYLDPTTCSAEAAMDSWIQTACANLSGDSRFGRIARVGVFFDSIFSARLAVLFEKDPAAADTMLALQNELHKQSARMSQEVSAAAVETQQALARYYPKPSEAAHEKPESGDDFETRLDREKALNAALIENQKLCNQRAAAGEAMDDLLVAIEKLEAQADTLNNPVDEAKTRLGHAYILFQIGRGADLGPVAREARRRLLAGRAASLSSLSTSVERTYYLDSLKQETRSCIMTGDFKGSLKICEETIRDFETERYCVSSEYRQSALLSYVAFFYTYAAFSAFKLQRWDNMLEAIDLIKARSAIRNRLMPDAPQNLNSNLQQEFEALDAALGTDPKNEDLKTRRRQLWDLLSIARAQGGASAQVPAMSVASLQAALEEDEALIGYFWLAGTVILAIAVDRERFHAERISLKPEELTRLQEFVAFVQTLKSSQKMDRSVEKLGAILLPDFLRDFMKTKKRIIFSPHHSLHLFPFHAARWGTDGFVGTEFAVSYAPNFCSVLLPWAQPVENRVLAMGIRDFADKTVPSLENVEEDSTAIAAYYRANGAAVELALGTEATRECIEALRNQGKLEQFRCVHLGTHGLSVFETPDQPLESRLLVQDGALDAMDIANLRLSAELVMLSACHSGQRAIQLRNLGEVPGDDIFGLQSALFRSGVRAIVGTLWLVETSSSSPIVRGFHKHYAAGKPAEVALQFAVKEYLENPVGSLTGVYYWAPYFISFIGRRQIKEGDLWKN